MNINPILQKKLTEQKSAELQRITRSSAIIQEIKNYRTGREVHSPLEIRVWRRVKWIARPIRSFLFDLNRSLRLYFGSIWDSIRRFLDGRHTHFLVVFDQQNNRRRLRCKLCGAVHWATSHRKQKAQARIGPSSINLSSFSPQGAGTPWGRHLRGTGLQTNEMWPSAKGVHVIWFVKHRSNLCQSYLR